MRAAVRPCAGCTSLPPSLPGSCGPGFAVTPAFTLCPILPSRVTPPRELALGVCAHAQALAEGEFLNQGAQPQSPHLCAENTSVYRAPCREGLRKGASTLSLSAPGAPGAAGRPGAGRGSGERFQVQRTPFCSSARSSPPRRGHSSHRGPEAPGPLPPGSGQRPVPGTGGPARRCRRPPAPSMQLGWSRSRIRGGEKPP